MIDLKRHCLHGISCPPEWSFETANSLLRALLINSQTVSPKCPLDRLIQIAVRQLSVIETLTNARVALVQQSGRSLHPSLDLHNREDQLNAIQNKS
jgi:hypothetical protein